VAVPEQDTLRQSPEPPTKRRKSSVTEHEPKRRRLSAQDGASPGSQPRPAPESEQPTEKRPVRRGREDERKRGQRLFGGLLGTLSQSSNSAAQKRRADIEKRQQDKLKSQDDEYDGLKKRRKERRDAIRRKEKPFYEREAVGFPFAWNMQQDLTYRFTDADAPFKFSGHGTFPEDTVRTCIGT
jgi:hypothetical protein